MNDKKTTPSDQNKASNTNRSGTSKIGRKPTAPRAAPEPTKADNDEKPKITKAKVLRKAAPKAEPKEEPKAVPRVRTDAEADAIFNEGMPKSKRPRIKRTEEEKRRSELKQTGKREIKPAKFKRGAGRPKFESDKPIERYKPKPRDPNKPAGPKTDWTPKEAVNADEPAKEGMRLNKFMAHAGVAARRAADELIKKGLVKINGTVVLEMGYRVMPTDVVVYNGKPLKINVAYTYVLLNKPKDFITTTNDEKDRRTVMQLVKNATEDRIYPVGRLDRKTTGLLLLTNDGELAQKLTHPSKGVKKIYHVVTDKPVTAPHLKAIAEGLTLEDGFAMVDDVAYTDLKDKTHVGIEIHIGKNRIVRRIFEHLGYEIEKLDRVNLGGIVKKDLARGNWRYLSEKEVAMLKHLTR